MIANAAILDATESFSVSYLNRIAQVTASFRANSTFDRPVSPSYMEPSCCSKAMFTHNLQHASKSPTVECHANTVLIGHMAMMELRLMFAGNVSTVLAHSQMTVDGQSMTDTFSTAGPVINIYV